MDVNRVVTIEVRGMTCHRCVDNIQTKVRDKPGINNIEVSKRGSYLHSTMILLTREYDSVKKKFAVFCPELGSSCSVSC